MLVDAPFTDVTREVIGAAVEVHRSLGPGLLVEDCVIVEVKAVDRLAAPAETFENETRAVTGRTGP
jgi:hypothetical protein